VFKGCYSRKAGLSSPEKGFKKKYSNARVLKRKADKGGTVHRRGERFTKSRTKEMEASIRGKGLERGNLKRSVPGGEKKSDMERMLRRRGKMGLKIA